jgi:hypothetical protein
VADSPPPASPAPLVTRRMVLATSGLIVAAAGAGTARVGAWWDAPASRGYACLTSIEADLVDAIAEGYFPPGGTPALGGGDAGIARYLDGLFAMMDEPTPTLLRMLLHALDDSCRVSRMSGFCALSVEERGEVLRGWTTSDSHLVRGAMGGLLTFIGTAYCGHPEVRAACGWEFPCGYER